MLLGICGCHALARSIRPIALFLPSGNKQVQSRNLLDKELLNVNWG